MLEPEGVIIQVQANQSGYFRPDFSAKPSTYFLYGPQVPRMRLNDCVAWDGPFWLVDEVIEYDPFAVKIQRLESWRF